jgi:molybdopterin biosynthesis enzyme MoaB
MTAKSSINVLKDKLRLVSSNSRLLQSRAVGVSVDSTSCIAIAGSDGSVQVGDFKIIEDLEKQVGVMEVVVH